MGTNYELINELNTIFTSYIGTLDTGDEGYIDTSKIRSILGKIFTGKECADVIFTHNTDKLFFGVTVSPTILADDFLAILFSEEDYVVNRYSVEIDSKLFDIGMTAEEVVAYILYEISAMITTAAPTWEVREIIDYHLAREDDVIDIKKSVNYSQILILAIKDAMIKMSSIRYKDTDGILSNAFINNEELRDVLISAENKVRSSFFGIGTGVEQPKLVLLAWAFNLYQDAKHYAKDAIETLEQAKNCTASKLMISEMDKTIKSLQRLNFDIANESARILNEGKKNGFLAGLKRNGLRSIEDDLYEYSVRAKNSETEEETYFTLRGINSRLNIIEEYIYENENSLSEAELARWRDVAKRYRDLREYISTKKLHKKSYGLWYDYDKLDDLD